MDVRRPRSAGPRLRSATRLGAITALTTRYRYEKKYPMAKGTKIRSKVALEVFNGSPLSTQDERLVFIRRTDSRKRRVVCQARKGPLSPLGD